LEVPGQAKASGMNNATIKVLLIDDDEEDYMLTQELFP